MSFNLIELKHFHILSLYIYTCNKLNCIYFPPLPLLWRVQFIILFLELKNNKLALSWGKKCVVYF